MIEANQPSRHALSIGQILAGITEPGKQRRTGQPVWRNSYYEGTIEDRVYRPLMGGNKRNAKRVIAAVLRAARELEKKTRRERQELKPGARNGILGQVGLDILEAMYNRFLDYRTGRLEPSIEAIANATGYAYSAVHAALVRLRDCGFVQWVRRSRPLDNAGNAGPQVEQIPNAYAMLIPEAIKPMVRHIMRDAPEPACERWRREQHIAEFNEMVSSVSARQFVRDIIGTGDKALSASLDRLAALLDKREEQEREFSSKRETGRSHSINEIYERTS